MSIKHKAAAAASSLILLTGAGAGAAQAQAAKQHRHGANAHPLGERHGHALTAAQLQQIARDRVYTGQHGSQSVLRVTASVRSRLIGRITMAIDPDASK